MKSVRLFTIESKPDEYWYIVVGGVDMYSLGGLYGILGWIKTILDKRKK